jgi:hypothetical protein
MMLWLAIAQLRGWLTSKGETIVSPTQNVGHVSPEHTTQHGSHYSAEITFHQPHNHLPHQPAKPAAKVNSNLVQQTRQAPLSNCDKAPVQTPMDNQCGDNGKLKAIAPQTHQPVKPAQRPKRKAAKQDMLDKKTTPAKASVPTPMDKRCGDNTTL